jgi:hypothetical protein
MSLSLSMHLLDMSLMQIVALAEEKGAIANSAQSAQTSKYSTTAQGMAQEPVPAQEQYLLAASGAPWRTSAA